MKPHYLTTPEAILVTKRLDKQGLLDPELRVQLLPVSLPEFDTINYVLRYFASEDDESLLTQVIFLEKAEGAKSTKFIDQLSERMKWSWGTFKPNSELLRHLPTLSNMRRFKLQLLME